MAGRGGYYGSLHPAYQGFHDQYSHSFTDDPSATRNIAATSSKLDKILTLLHNQDDKIASLTTEVGLFVQRAFNTAVNIIQVASVKEEPVFSPG